MKLINDSKEARPLEVVRPSAVPAPVREFPVSASPAAAPPERSEWVRFAELMDVLSRRKALILFCICFGVTAAAAVSYWSTPMYRATASLEVQGVNQDFLDLKNVDPSAKADSFTPESYIQTQAEILQEDVLLDRVIARLHLTGHPAFQPKPGPVAALAGALHFMPAMKQPEENRPIDRVRKELMVTPSPHSNIIKVSYESSDPKLSADFVNTLVDEFTEYNQEARLNAANQVGRWLGPELQEMKQRLDGSESALSNATQKSGLLLSSGAGTESVAEEQLRNIQRELAAAQADRMAKESLYRTIAQTPLDSLPAALETNALKEDRLKLADLKRQRAELGSLYTDGNYRVERVQAQIDELQAAIQRERQNIPKQIQSEFAASLSREMMLAKTYNSQAALVGKQALERIRYETLKRAVDDNRQIYQSTLMKVNEAGIAAAIKPSSVRLLGPATPPLLPYQPNLPLNFSIGIAAGLCLGLVSAASLERNRQVLRAPAELRAFIDVPLLGAVPKATDQLLHSGPRKLLLDSRPEVHLELVSWEEKRSALSESFQEILASLVYSESTHVLLVTSAMAAEGKTTVTSNVGIGLAEIGKRVLLIDGDIRKPRLHDIFKQTNTWGLSNLLSETTSIKDLPAAAITKKTTIPGLSLLPSGPPAEQLTNLFYSPRLQDLMARFRQDFDYVLLDVPPALQFADARIMAHCADAVILVARANRTHPDTVREALERFYAVGVPVLGTILNDFDTRRSDHYRHGYGYNYGYRN